MVLDPQSTTLGLVSLEVPGIIWTYWEQGWQDAPALCKASFLPWKSKPYVVFAERLRDLTVFSDPQGTRVCPLVLDFCLVFVGETSREFRYQKQTQCQTLEVLGLCLTLSSLAEQITTITTKNNSFTSNLPPRKPGQGKVAFPFPIQPQQQL